MLVPHSSTPWSIATYSKTTIKDAHNSDIAEVRGSNEQSVATAGHVVLAVNAHGALVNALKGQVSACGECDPTGGFGPMCHTCRKSRQALELVIGKEAWSQDWPSPEDAALALAGEIGGESGAISITQPLGVACSICDAGIGVPCIRHKVWEEARWVGEMHFDRVRKSQDQEARNA